jgi:hypothetical protein
MRKVYFRYKIIELNKNQGIILRKIYKELLLRKLNLRATLSQNILYSRVTAVKIRILIPKTAILMITLKLYLAYKYQNSRSGNLINYIEASRII